MVARQPGWGKESSAALRRHSDDFRQSLHDIAEGIARHEPSEKVLERHVKVAFELLAIAGNHRRPWYTRHELEIGLGGILVGGSTSVSDWVEALYPVGNDWQKALIASVTITMMGVGLFLVLHGWLRVQSAIYWGLSGPRTTDRASLHRQS